MKEASQKNYQLQKRKYVIGGIATIIILVYIARLFFLQLMSEDFKQNADSNAFLKRCSFLSVAPSWTATASCSSTTSRPMTSWW